MVNFISIERSQIKATNPYFVPVRGSKFKFLTKSSDGKEVRKLWPACACICWENVSKHLREEFSNVDQTESNHDKNTSHRTF